MTSISEMPEFTRLFIPPHQKSFFLFGPRGTGKSTWIRRHYPTARIVDLLAADTYNRLLARPQDLLNLVPGAATREGGPIVIDEVQKIPVLLDEVHRLIETRRLIFILTGSSARKLRRQGVNLLAGRALTRHFFPLTAAELGARFDLKECLQLGTLPGRFSESDPGEFLQSYVATYLREEVQQEGLTRNLGAFRRFLESATFSQAQPLVVSNVAHDAQVERKTVEEYFQILDDLMIGTTLPVFSRRAKRDLLKKSKFFFFDAGVYHALRPRGPLDSDTEVGGASFETLVFNELRALNSYKNFGYTFYFWRTKSRHEVDLVLYGERGLLAFEIKLSPRVRREDLAGLQEFKKDYPMARCFLLYTGDSPQHESGVEVLPAQAFFSGASEILEKGQAT